MSQIFYPLALLVGIVLASPLEHSEYLAPLHIPPAPTYDLINDSYIVMFREDILPSTFASHLSFLQYANQTEGGNQITHVYDSVVARGFAGTFSREFLKMIRKRPEVQYVEQDQYSYATDFEADAPWGLARINHRNKLTQSQMHYYYERSNGYGVTVYVIDTGVYYQHAEFYGRARWGFNFAKGSPDKDETGHGTHVAGTIASWKYGVAKSAEITSLKVLSGPNGRGTNSDIIAAIIWAEKDAKRLEQTQPQKHKGTVINMSLAGAQSNALDTAANNAVRAGVHVVVAAGNENTDACKSSPAAAVLPITVGASTLADEKASFSNWGTCVDVFGPGTQILSTAPSDPQASQYMSGTSMATPHVVGLLANFLSIYPHWSFNPRITASNPGASLPLHDSTLLSAYIAGYSMLPSFLTNILPPPSSFQLKKEETVPAPELAPVLTPDFLKRALLTLASHDKILSRTLPAGTPNLLIYNNMTHTDPRNEFEGTRNF